MIDRRTVLNGQQDWCIRLPEPGLLIYGFRSCCLGYQCGALALEVPLGSVQAR